MCAPQIFSFYVSHLMVTIVIM